MLAPVRVKCSDGESGITRSGVLCPLLIMAGKKRKCSNETKSSAENEKFTKKKEFIKRKNSFSKKILKIALAHLRNQISRRGSSRKRNGCKVEDFDEARTDRQVKLRCRQLSSVVRELRKSILRQDWDETATLLMVLCYPGIKLYSSIIIRTCFILLFCHPNSSFELLCNFIRCITGYFMDEDVNKFIKILLVLKEKPPRKVNNCRILKYYYNKLTVDPYFGDL